MADPFIAEIRLFAGTFPPNGWAYCNGQLLPISQNTPLFSLLGTTYGGDGKSTFALPNLMNAAPMHHGQGPGLSLHVQGETGGAAAVSLLTHEIPSHTHQVQGFSGGGGESSPAAASWAGGGRGRPPLFAAANDLAPMAWDASSPAGASSPHNNLPPYLALNFIIALRGVFPPRT